jgi:zinc transport system ATP-binding protein
MADILEITNLTVTLGNFKAIDNLSIKVQGGEFVAILGPNGAGKSTLLKAILGLIQNASGEIRILGFENRKVPAGSIGYVPQIKTLDKNFPAVTCDLVASGLKMRWPAWMSKADHDLVADTLELVGAHHLIHKPLGWLSGGELQRVYLARAIIRKPKLLLLDEPATGIDAVGEDDMYRILEAYLAENKITVMMVTHDWLAARHHATRALLLNRHLVSFGAPDAALDDKNMREAFGHIGHSHNHTHDEAEDIHG